MSLRDASKRLFAVIGDPVSHSMSPFIMRHAFDQFEIDASYTAIRVTSGELAAFVGGMREGGFAGVNVTYPLKESVLPLVDESTPAVHDIGASNILKATDKGITAHNTDAVGTALALEQIAGVTISGKRACVYGAGGAARAAAYGLLSAGTQSVAFVVRDKARAERSIVALRQAFPDHRIDCYDIPAEFDIIVNATPVGMAGFETSTLLDDDSMIQSHHIVFDFVYHPLETPLIAMAKRRGAQTLDGLALLVAQAQAGFHFWTGNEFSITEMYEVARHASNKDGSDK
jgi:shikimate dehydrogenase